MGKVCHARRPFPNRFKAASALLSRRSRRRTARKANSPRRSDRRKSDDRTYDLVLSRQLGDSFAKKRFSERSRPKNVSKLSSDRFSGRETFDGRGMALRARSRATIAVYFPLSSSSSEQPSTGENR